MIAEELGWKDCIQGSDGVVNLAGMPISTRWFSEVSTYFQWILTSYDMTNGPIYYTKS